MSGLLLLLSRFVLRFFVFNFYESPKYLMGHWHEAEEVEVVHKVARYNEKSSSLRLDMLRDKDSHWSGVPIQVILSVIGVSGALLAVWTVQLPLLGRRGSLAISTILTGVFLFASTTARHSAARIDWNCNYNFMSNIMYGVLYTLSPELFLTKDRGTDNALVAAANRVFGIMALTIAFYANLTTSVPVYISGALFIVAGFIPVLLPFERRGKESL
ncbi:hypothetical protein H4582DRAFT_2210001 [Lactarius indigo]|nr:hypothetical protein H4582DRAFT_2210001 [Lactarius indigo]